MKTNGILETGRPPREMRPEHGTFADMFERLIGMIPFVDTVYHATKRFLTRIVQEYNQDDCVSTLRLRNWLEGLRDELAGGAHVTHAAGARYEDAAARLAEARERRRSALLARVEAAEAHGDWLAAEQALAQLLASDQPHTMINKAIPAAEARIGVDGHLLLE